MTDVELFDQALLGDAEAYVSGQIALGEAVDPPAERRSVYATITTTDAADRVPIVPAWARSSTQRREVAVAASKTAGYRLAFHATRSPKYAIKTIGWAPVGVARTASRVLGWVFDGDGHEVRKATAALGRPDPDAYLRLQRHRDNRVRRRARIAGAGALAVLGIGLADASAAPGWVQVCSACGAVLAFARLGRPADKPILDRVTLGQAFVRLTADLVREALVSLGIPRLKDGAELKFDQPIHRDTGGWIASVVLPGAVEASQVVERRSALAGALRVPVDQCWPTVGDKHPGHLVLWIAPRPVSLMPAPRWELASERAKTSVFDGYPIGFDERQRPVRFTPFQRNLLIGGQPGSGKTYAARSVVLGALLDPLAEVWLAAFKAAEDFVDVEPWCSRYVCGLDVASLDEGEAMVTAGLREVQRRQELLGKLRREGKIAEGRTDAKLAAAGFGLHPLVLVFDEVHELFLHSKTAGEAMARLIKQGRSAGVVVVLVTQVAGKDSVPPEITRVVSSRWCLSVLDQVANDQIMGTGAYKRGLTGTVFRPGTDAGWGVTSGIADGQQGAARAYYPTARDLAVLLKRIGDVRAGSTHVEGQPMAPRRDVLADVIRVFAECGRPRLHWSTIAERLPELDAAYTGMTADAVSATLRGAGVSSVDVRDGTTVRKGCTAEDVRAAVARREIEA